MVVAKGLGEGKIGSSCLTDTEFQFYKKKKFWRLIVQQCEYT